MASFNMPTTKRLPGFDPNLLPKRPGVDYAARADNAWWEIKENLTAARAESDRLLAASLRIQDGETWLRENVESDRRMEAYQKLNELRNEAVGIDINTRCLYRVAWNNVMVLYACLAHIDRDQWLRENHADLDGSSPEAIWQAVCPGREQPGSYPPEKREQWLDRKLTYVGWDADVSAAPRWTARG